MDPKLTPQGTLSQINNPLVDSASIVEGDHSLEQPINDTARQPQQPSAGPGLGTLQNPNRPFGASIGSILMSKGVNLPTVSSPHVQKIGDAITKTISENPQAAAQPGGVMRAVVAGGLQALTGALGDMAAIGTVPAGGGALTGIARTMAAHGQRMAQQQQQQFENDEKKRVDDANIAHMQIMTVHEQQAIRIAGNDAKREQYKFDQAIASDMDSVNAPVMKSGMNDEQLHEWYKGLKPEERANAIPIVDHFEKEEDGKGEEFLRPIFKVYNKGADVPVNEKSAELINEWAPQEQDLVKGQKLPVGSYVSILGQAKLAAAQDANRQKLINENKKNKAEGEKFEQEVADKKEHNQLGLDIAPTMNHYGQDPAKALDAMQKNGTSEAAEMGRKIQKYYGPALIETTRKNAEEARHNQEEENIKRAAKGGFKGDPNAKTPEEFLNSLDPQAQAVVKLIGTGKAPLNNPGYLLARNPEILEAVAKAYPDFDISKVKGYQDTYIDFTKGKTSTQLESGATALKHLRELQALNTVYSHIPGTPSYNAYMNKADTLSTELARFYGADTVPGIAAIKETLTKTLPGNRDAAITTQAKSMGDKFDSLEQKWLNAAPSKAYEAPMPGIDLAARQARATLDSDYAKQHPELGIKGEQKQAPKGVQVPEGKVHMRKPNGEFIFVDKAKQKAAEDLGATVVNQ